MASLVLGSCFRGEPGVPLRRTARAAALVLSCALSLSVLSSSDTARAADVEANAASAPTPAPAPTPTPPPGPSPENRKAAGAAFAQGEAAFAAGKYAEAGEAFEDAFSFVPHPDALLNAARAWEKANELARAANLFERYIKVAPESAPDRKLAISALERLAKKLGRLEIFAPGADAIELDDRPFIHSGSTTIAYVSPGTHVVRGRFGASSIQRTQAVEQGGVASVALAVDGSASGAGGSGGAGNASGSGGAGNASGAGGAGNASGSGGAGNAGGSGGAGASGPIDGSRGPDAPDEPYRRLPPLAIAIGGGVTAAFLGATIASGVDTLNARRDFDDAPTTDLLEAGKSKQTRTNILLGVTVLSATLTTVAAVWLVRWQKPAASAKLGLGAGTIVASGRF